MNKKILSTLLAMVMAFYAFVTLIPIRAAAADVEEVIPSHELATDAALLQEYSSAIEKIEKDPFMELYLTCAGYRLYCNPYTGEVIYLNMTTGQALSTNPYDVQPDTVSKDVKAQLLSQVAISFSGADGIVKSMYSFTEAAQRGQIIVKNIKNGIRVQYTIGRENTKFLLPGWIMKQDFEEKILAPFKEYVDLIREEYGETDSVYINIKYQYDKFVAYYALQNANADSGKPQAAIDAMQKAFPITKEKDENGRFYEIYTLDSAIQTPAKKLLESYIRTYAPEYGYDDLDEDHAKTGYVADEEVAPLFKLALEYTIDETDGSLSIRLPANSIRYDETAFTLECISPLNYFGAADMNNDGYAFYPDGSGAIFDFADLYNEDEKIKVSWSNKVYGQDYAYYEISGKNQAAIRIPVYGMVGSREFRVAAEGSDNIYGEGSYVKQEQSGYLAILEEGDALADITFDTGATAHKYASIFTKYYPRPKDSYDITGAAVSSSTSNKWTVVSDRKYTGSYKTKVIMLTDESLGQELVSLGALKSYYTAENWMGMALAYRDYLESKNIISRFTNADVKDDIPLYIESFGTIKTTQQILSMPVTVSTPLTTFEDIMTMYDDLASEGIKNINFKLTGFANGGMVSKYPTKKLKWEKAAGGTKGFNALLDYAKENEFGVYPDFDFLYIADKRGVSLKKLGARTVDNRYTSRRIYDAVYQSFFSYFELCAATSEMESYYDKFASKYGKYDPIGISVATLASDLNSNFDEDNPSNRNDAKEDVIDLFKKIEADFGSVMSEGGNIFAVQYLDHLLSAPLDGSNYRYAASSVPFFGTTLHGYINFAGTPLNESGNTDYNLLKTIENGASLYYLLSYRNSTLMKQDGRWSQYYSIRFDIWFDEMVRQYKEMNEAIGDLQTSVIVAHDFLIGERIPDSEEVIRNDEILSQAIYTAVAEAIDEVKNNRLGEYRVRLELYQKLKKHDDKLKSLAGEELNAYLAENFSECTEEKLAEIASAYAGGKDCEAFLMKTGMKVGVDVDLDAIYASIEEFIGKALTEAQKNEIYVVIADKICVFDIEDKVLEIINGDRIKAEQISLTREKLYQIVKLVVDGADYETLNSKLGDIINFEIKEELLVDDATIAEIATALSDCIFNGDEDVVCDSVEIEYNFNITDSKATDGENYVSTAYTLDDERIVMVTYSNATKTSAETKNVSFVLNYNIFDVKVNIDGTVYEIPSYGYVRINNK